MEISNSINYTVIIPHKNIPKLLERCLHSIPIRDDVQVIIVDDDSDEKKVDFASFPGLSRSNTEVYFTKEGKGAGYARNVGLTKAKGKWVLFADADDFFNECLNEIFDKYKNIEADLIFFQTNSVDDLYLKPVKSRGEYYNNWIKESIATKKIHDNIKFRIHPPWGKYFSGSLIRNYDLKFDEVLASNDVMFSTKAGYYSKNVKCDSSFLYCSTVRNNSLEYTITEENISSRLEVALRQYTFLTSISKVKYRMNIWDFIFKLKKLNKKEYLNYILKSYKTVKKRHFIIDYLLMRYAQRKNI